MSFDPTVSLGQLGTVMAAAVAGGTLVYTFRRDRRLRMQERADKVRDTIGHSVVQLERWIQLAGSLFVHAQPLMVDADAEMVSGKPPTKIRDAFWQETTRIRAAIMAKRLDEKLETPSAGLYAYEPVLYDRWKRTLAQLQVIDDQVYDSFLMSTQHAILDINKRAPRPPPAALGNDLRQRCGLLEEHSATKMEDACREYREVSLRVIQATDVDVVLRRVEMRITVKSVEGPSPPAVLSTERKAASFCVQSVRRLSS